MKKRNAWLATAALLTGIGLAGCDHLRSPYLEQQPANSDSKSDASAPKSTFPVSERYGSVATGNTGQSS